MICLGAKDVTNGAYTKGVFELAAGASGVAVIGYYVYCAVSDLIKANALPEQLDLFLSQHNDEIHGMYRTGEPSGSWSKIGNGVSKNAYQHPDSPYIIKILYRDHWSNMQNDLEEHYNNVQDAKEIIETSHLDRVVVPEIYLIQTASGPIVAEQKFELTDYSAIPNGLEKEVAIRQLEDVVWKGGFCDIAVDPMKSHNAGFLKSDGSTPKIAIFDLDCRKQITLPNSLRAGLLGVAAKTTQFLFSNVVTNIMNNAQIAAGAAGLAYGISYAIDAGAPAFETVGALGIGALAVSLCRCYINYRK